MSRIFISLSLMPLLLVCFAMGTGWWIGDYNGLYAEVMSSADGPQGTQTEDQVLEDLALIGEPQRRFTIHFQIGLATALAVVLINSLSVTYLIGTSRWVKEVCEAYELETKFSQESSRLKRATFPWSIVGVTAILLIVACGAAADPGTLRDNTAQWVRPHLLVSVLGSCAIVYAIYVQGVNLQRNARVIQQVVEEVRRARQLRGLPVETS